MDGPGHQFLAGAAFAVNDHRCFTFCCFLNDIIHFLHAGGFSDDAVKTIVLIQLPRKQFDFLIQPVQFGKIRENFHRPQRHIVVIFQYGSVFESRHIGAVFFQ